MDRVTRHLSTAFETDRLLLRPLGQSPQHFTFIDRVLQDPTVSGLARTSVIKIFPQQAVEDRFRAAIDKSHLAIMMVLNPTHKPSGQQDHTPAEDARPAGEEGEEEYVGWFLVNPCPAAGLSTYGIASLGITLSPEHSGKGLGTEALRWVLDWCFQQAGLRRVELDTVAFNERAVALYKKVGFVEEGRRRKFQMIGGEWFDNVMLSVLEEEYWERRGGRGKTLLREGAGED